LCLIWRFALVILSNIIIYYLKNKGGFMSETQTSAPVRTGNAVADALIAVGQWVIENNQTLQIKWSEIAHGVTNVKRWENETSSQVVIEKVDGGRRERVDLAPNSNKNQDFWLPWCNSDQEYLDHYMTIKINGAIAAYVFQHGDSIRASANNAFDPNAMDFPGLANAGGERRMIFRNMDNGQVAFALSAL
jgi:hypothetical protein